MGMSKGSGTRSGLLWEVERLLNEVEELPQVLVMENVTQVHGEKNISDFEDWIRFLESKGYSNYCQDLNAKDYGIPQSRDRTFMVSILGDYYYRFPEPIKLEKQFKDLLEDGVEDKYYITSEKAKVLIDNLILEGKILTDRQTDRQTGVDLCPEHAELVEVANTIKARYDSGLVNHKYDNTGVVEITSI